MPRDTAGNYTLAPGNPVAGGTIISVSWANPTMDDLAGAMTDSLSRTGLGGMLVPFLNADGIVITPGISFVLEPNSGLYRAATSDLRMSIAGSDTTRWIDATVQPIGDQRPFEVWDGVTWRAVAFVADVAHLENDQYLQSRNAADDADIGLIKLSTTNQIEIGGDGSVSTLLHDALTVTGAIEAQNALTVTLALDLLSLAGGGDQNIGVDNAGRVVIVSGTPGSSQLNNDQFLEGRNLANTDWLNIVKINTANEIEFGPQQAIFPGAVAITGVLTTDSNAIVNGTLTIPNDTFYTGRQQNNLADVSIVKVNASNQIEFGPTPSFFNANLTVQAGELTVSNLASTSRREVLLLNSGQFKQASPLAYAKVTNPGNTFTQFGVTMSRISEGVYLCTLAVAIPALSQIITTSADSEIFSPKIIVVQTSSPSAFTIRTYGQTILPDDRWFPEDISFTVYVRDDLAMRT